MTTNARALRQTEQEQHDADDSDDDDLSSTSAQDVELVDERRDARLQHAELTIDTERE